jgi:ribA/ribD-fused uncharacterized protein
MAYSSAEQFMMSAKALLFGDTETAERIRMAPHPGAAKALGRQVQGFDEPLWAERRFEIVVAGPGHRNTGRDSTCLASR